MTNPHSGELRRESVCVEAVEGIAELDLFEELSLYAELTPEERDRRDEALASAASSKRHAPVEAPAPFEGGFEVVEMSKTRPLVHRPPQRAAQEPERHAQQPQPSRPPSQPLQKQPAQQAVKPSAALGPVCQACGKTNAESDLFCDACGTFLDEAMTLGGAEMQPVVENLCTDCGSPVDKDDIFCPSCGSVMGAD